MMLRVLVAGALVGLPLLVSGASAHTPSAPAASTSPAPAPASPAAAPSAPDALVSSFMPTPNVAAPPASGAEATPAGPPPAAAPVPVEAAAPPKPKKFAPPPPPLETALRRSGADASADTFFATAKASERYSAIVDAGGWPTDLAATGPGTRSGGGEVAHAAHDRRLSGRCAGERPRVGRRVDRGGETFPVAHGIAPDRPRRRRDAEGDQCSGEKRFSELASSADRLSMINSLRSALCRRQSAVDLGRGGRERASRAPLYRHRRRPRASLAGDFRAYPGHQPQSDLDGADLDHQEGNHPADAARSGLSLARNIRILDGSGQEINPKSINWSTERAANYTLSQDSGAGNALGSIRIGMPNKDAVYMHDTPAKALFGPDYRFLSHGCVRVQGVYDYAAWLLEGTGGGPGGWDKPAMEAKIKEGAPYNIKLSKSVPVIWVYLTGWANGDGLADFRDDVYGIDPVGEAQASAQSAPVR